MESKIHNKVRAAANAARTGQAPCGPAPAVQARSWGAACPTGACTSNDLAANLGRAFAGERYPCRELTYWVYGQATAGGVWTFSDNAILTICPTRIIVVTLTALAGGEIMSAFTIGNQNQMVGDPIPLTMLAPNSYQIIPYVTDCVRAGIPFGFTLSGLAASDFVDFGLVGPAIG